MAEPAPPSDRALARALAGFAECVGSAWVSTAEDKLKEKSDPFSLDLGRPRRPAGVVAPASVEEVQGVVRVARECKVPLWTVSRGRNLGYGGALPRADGTVVLDLDRMNRILEVSEEGAYAVVEPGVTFFDLYNHVRDNDIKLWISAPGLGWGSVIGNALERGFGYTPYGDHSAQQCGMEVVLANGDVVRTGLGAMAGGRCWQLYKPSFGPSPDGLFMQSNLGIVTKMGLWMMPRPERLATYSARFFREDALGDIVDTLRPLRLDGTIESTVTLGSAIHSAAKRSKRADWYDGPGALPREIIERRIIPELGIGWWNLAFGIVGPESLVRARLDLVGKAMAQIADSETQIREYDGNVGEDEIDPADRLRAGIPNLAAYEIVGWAGGGGGTIAFAPVSPFNGADAVKQYSMVLKRGQEFGFDYYGSFQANVRSMNHIYQIFFDQDDKGQVQSLHRMFAALVDDAARQGYAEYRAHVAFMDLIAQRFDFNDHALLRLQETLKDALDPEGILSPGKQGVWPAAMRNRPRAA